MRTHSLVIGCLLMAFIFLTGSLLAVTSFNDRINEIQQAQSDGVTRAYINRAEACRLQVALSISLDDACLDPHVTQFYNPDDLPTTGGGGPVAKMICKLLEAQDIADENCPAP